jgi:ferredoxin--NADP+ reductase
MPYEVLDARWLNPSVRWLKIRAPHVLRNYQPGQFIILRASDGGERIPLTVANVDANAGAIELVVQAVGLTTRALCALEPGQTAPDIAGPLGKPTEIEMVGHAVVVGGGVGTAVIYPQARALKAAGNRVTAIIGGRSAQHIILEEQLAAICDAVLPCTDDGSYGFHGFVTDRLRQFIERAVAPPAVVLCAGPVPMMRAVAEVTRPFGVKTIASLNPIMVDGTGMCGGCRIRVGGHIRFACVDGPEFDAHAVDFNELADRLNAYREHEQRAVERCWTAGAPAPAGTAAAGTGGAT